MAKSVNKVQLLGNLGKDAETSFTTSGTAVTKFSVATSYSRKGGDGKYVDETDWHSVILWNAEKLAAYLTKGRQVFVEGRLKTRSYEKDGERKYVTEVVAQDVILVGDRGDGARQTQPVSQPRPSPQAAIPVSAEDDDVPF